MLANSSHYSWTSPTQKPHLDNFQGPTGNMKMYIARYPTFWLAEFYLVCQSETQCRSQSIAFKTLLHTVSIGSTDSITCSSEYVTWKILLKSVSGVSLSGEAPFIFSSVCMFA